MQVSNQECGKKRLWRVGKRLTIILTGHAGDAADDAATATWNDARHDAWHDAPRDDDAARYVKRHIHTDWLRQ